MSIPWKARWGTIMLLFPLAGGGAWAGGSAGHSTAGGAARSHSTRALPAALRPVLYRALAKDAGAAYRINKDGCAELAKQGLKACFDNDGAHFTGTAALSLHLVAWGRSGGLAAVTAVRPKISGNEVSYAHGDLTAWWRVLPLGFEQGFTIAQRPSGHGELTLVLGASRQDAGVLTLRHSRAGGNPVGTSPSIPLRSEGGKELAWGKLRYGKLVVTDANGKVVPATFRVVPDREQARSYPASEQILIAVNDAHAVYPLTVDPLVWLEQKVAANDGAAGDGFGSGVALDGPTAFIGAPNASSSSGAVYVFTESNGTWAQAATLTASDGAAGDGFGSAVALDGLTVLVGAPNATVNNSTDQGAAYVFDVGTWTQAAKLTASDGAAGDDFGAAVALDGLTVLVGAPNAIVNNNTGQGAAYVFNQNEVPGVWTEAQILTASDGGGLFGSSVALGGTTALIGAPFASPNNNATGAAYVFDESNGTWTQTQELAPAGPSGGLDFFGWSVALDGTTALVGAPCPITLPGWCQGFSDRPDAYVFTEANGLWSEAQMLSSGPAEGQFGYSVALNGATAFVGAPYAILNGSFDQGAVFVFAESGGSWNPTAEFTASDGVPFDGFGWSVALDGTTALVGAPGAVVNNITQGAAYFYGQSDLGLAISAPGSVPRLQQYVSQTIVTNNSGADSLPVSVTIPVPGETSFVSVTPTPACNQSAGVVTCNLGSVPGNGGTATADVTLTVTGVPGGTNILNSAATANATPPLFANGFTQILCQAGYTTYAGVVGGSWTAVAGYSAPGGHQENAILYAPAGSHFGVHLIWNNPPQTYNHAWPVTQQVHHWGPPGSYTWGVKGIPGGASQYALCLKHPL